MITLLTAVASFLGFIVAYHTYGKWLANKVFRLSPDATVPSVQLRDDIDYIPTKKEIIFGHHFTSIAGTGPIVGPAIAVFWGWLPALLWVVFGSIFIGAVHDFGALVVSLRNRGQTVGEVAGRLITPRAKLLFLLTLFFALTIVIAIFGLVIASIFAIYPASVLSVWIEIPIAIAIGFWVYRRGGQLLFCSILALGLLYFAIYLGVYYFPITLSVNNPVVVWTLLLMAYCFTASVLPVWTLLQPRDFINSHQLVLALALLVGGLFVAGLSGEADLVASAPAYSLSPPTGSPPLFPFLFITIACGAISGFHCLVSSGTTSKQLRCETDAQYVGYGAMLLEGALAVIVILSCCAGIGMGVMEDGVMLTQREAWHTKYSPTGHWNSFGLSDKVGAFVEGGANFIHSLGIPLELAIGIIAVLVASFAATTLDTATRLQRYVIQELGTSLHIAPLKNKYIATLSAVGFGAAMAMIPAPGKSMGTGGLILWPLFGAINQLLAGLAFMVLVFYLWRRNINVIFAAIPMGIMLVMPAAAILWQVFNANSGWAWPLLGMIKGTQDWSWHHSHLLLTIGVATLGLQLWIVIEALLLFPATKGILEKSLPPLEDSSSTTQDALLSS